MHSRAPASRLACLLLLVFACVWPLAASAGDTAADLVEQMIALATDNPDGKRKGEIESLRTRLTALQRPSSGDKKKARQANKEGLAASSLARYDQARRHFLEARKADPADAEIAENLGYAHLMLGDFAAAGPAIFAALALEPSRMSAWGNLADWYARQDRPREATACYALLSQFAWGRASALEKIRKVAEKGDDARTREAAQRALRLIEGGGTQAAPAASAEPLAPPPPATATPPKPAPAELPPPALPLPASVAAATERSAALAEPPAPPSPPPAAPATQSPPGAAVAPSAATANPPASVKPALQPPASEPAQAIAAVEPPAAPAGQAGSAGPWGWLAGGMAALAVLVGAFFLRKRLAPVGDRLREAWNRFVRLARWAAPHVGKWLAWLSGPVVALFGKLPAALRWLRRKLPGLIAVALWALAVYWLFSGLASDTDAINRIQHRIDFTKPNAVWGDVGKYNFSLYLTVWSLIGAAALALAWFNPLRWRGGWRVFWGSLGLFLMLGRSLAGWLGSLPGPLLAYVPEWVLVWLSPVVLVLAGYLSVLAVSFTLLAVFLLITGPMVFLWNQIVQMEVGLHVFRYKRTGLIGYIVRFGYWLRGEEPPPATDDGKGARFATAPEAAALQNPEGAVFGHVGGRPLRLATGKHVLVMASTRGGKGVSLIVPHLLRYPGSAFVLDPKGENARATGGRRAALNDAVHYLDPFGISGKPPSRFNPLARFTPENMEAESKALAAALVMGEGGQRDHWTASAQQLLAALILYVFASPDVPPHMKDLRHVRRLLLGGMDAVLESMAESDLADGLLADLAASFLKTPEKEFGSILSTAQRETEILDNPFVGACLAATGAGGEVDFAAWHSGTMTVFLCLSAPKFPVFNRWLRLVLTSALDEMTDRLAPPPLPVCFMLDELATLGHLQAVENAVGLAAGYGIQLWNVFQDVAQMRDLYKGRWASFVGNAGVRALFSLDDYETADYWSKTVGGRLVPTVSYSQDVFGVASGQNASETFRPLLTPEDIMRQFAARNMLVLPDGSFPVVAQRVPYFEDGEVAGLWDDPRPPLAVAAA